MNINQIAYELYGKYFADLTAKACCRLGIRITNVQHLNKSSK